MNREQEAFLKAIAANPWDDETIRGIYSDWLLEHDQPEEAERQRKIVPAMRWLRDMAEQVGIAYRVLMAAADGFLEDNSEYLNMGENEDYKDWFWGREKEFWENYEIVTGTKVGEAQKEYSFFSCAC